jgi:predicted alpha/beta hydrolase family esterase
MVPATPDPAVGSPSSVLILHGWQNRRPAGHWQHVLADELRTDGIEVRYPQLPDPDFPDRSVWRELVSGEIAALTGPDRVIVAHSLAVWVILDLLAGGIGRTAERVLLAAPVARETLAANAPIAAFDTGLTDADLSTVIGAHGAVDVVCSDDDPYWPGGAAGWATGLGARAHALSGQGHLALGDGYGRWASVRDWVLGGGDIGPRLSAIG